MIESLNHQSVPIGADGTPYEYWERLRDWSLTSDTEIGWSDSQGGHWAVLGYQAGRELLHNHSAVSSRNALHSEYTTPGGRRLMWAQMDEPDHTKYVANVQRFFSPKAVAGMSEQLRASTNDLIDLFVDDGQADIVASLANEVPARMIAIMLGLPPEQGDQYRDWISAMRHVAIGDGENALLRKKLDEMDEYFHDLLAQRRRQPGDDLLSVLLQSDVDGRPLTEDELYDSCVMQLVGGIDNTAVTLASALWRLGWDRELRRRLVANPDLVPIALDEFLRYYPPTYTARKIVEDLTVAGVKLSAGQNLLFVLPVMNRDPRQFENPDVFIADRAPNRHISLGLGIHRCLGAHLAKMEARVVIEEVLRRIPEFELDPSKATSWRRGYTAGFDVVPIVFPEGGGSEWKRRRQWADRAA